MSGSSLPFPIRFKLDVITTELARIGESSPKKEKTMTWRQRETEKEPRKFSFPRKAQILLSAFRPIFPPTKVSWTISDYLSPLFGKASVGSRRHFPARDIATEDLQRHRDPQSIRSDTSPTRKDKNARASLPQQRAEAAPTGPAPRRQKEQMGKSADGDARVLLRVQRLGDPVQRCQQHRDHDSPCGRLLRGAIPIPLIKTSSAPVPSLSPKGSASTTRRRRDGLELNPRADQRADLRHH